MAVSKEHLCKLCGLTWPEDRGRVHGGVFTCTLCANAVQTIRRNLGSSSELQEWTSEETHSFFQALQKEKDPSSGKLPWNTVRAALIKRLTQRKIDSFSAQVQVEELPLSVWVARGWSAETVQRFPTVSSAEHGCDLYQLPVKTLTWAETVQQIEEKILEKEKHAQGKRKDKTLDIPVSADSSAGSDPKAEAKAVKKLLANNERVAALAARALGTLTGLENSLGKTLARFDGKPGVEVAALTLCQEARDKASEWATTARAAVNAHSTNQTLTDPANSSALGALPFNAESLKVLGQQASAAQKAVKASAPKAAPKPKTEPKTKAAANKRKREKQPE
eukprot:Skav208640  [mRNA]  locus=scaffold1081:116274:117278:+ [translate_table: standard]